jgi:hypothetical protein
VGGLKKFGSPTKKLLTFDGKGAIIDLSKERGTEK